VHPAEKNPGYVYDSHGTKVVLFIPVGSS